MSYGVIDISVVRSSELTRDLRRKAEALLSAEERAVVASRVFECHQREQLVARALSRTLLGRALGILPAALRFQKNAYGRPELVTPGGLHFNITHTVELIAIGLADSSIGIDAEPLARAPQILEVARSVFTEVELAGLEALDHGERARHAVLLWTAKEAYMKALGMGFACPPQSFGIDVEGSQVRLRGSAGTQWALTFQTLEDHGIATCAPHGYTPVLRRLGLPELLDWSPSGAAT